MIDTIITNMKTQIAAVITDYSELKLAYNVEDNSKLATSKTYSVLPTGAAETEGVLRHFTMDQSIIIQLTDDYIAKKTDDSTKRQIVIDLMDNALNIYKDMVNSKCGTPASVKNVRDLSIEDPIFFENDDTVQLNMNFTITYRVSL